MSNTVCFRDFEERDIDFVFKCKNDEKLNSLIVGDWHPFTYEEAANWVRGCMGEHETYKFWAICTNDDEKRIVGWVSLSQIDNQKKTAFYHGIVIGDPEYRDGMAWIESYLFIYDYAFEKLALDKIYGKALISHKASQMMRKVMFGQTISIENDAVIKDGKLFDVSLGVLNRDTYEEHRKNGDYNIQSVLKRMKKELKEQRCK